METIRCIAVDDSELDRMIITSYISKFKEIELLHVFDNPIIAKQAIKKLNPDVIFLDIDMPGMSGLELRSKVGDVPVCIFTTDHPEFALDSFELETLDYLLKPYSFERFSQTDGRIKEYLDVRRKAAELEHQNLENWIYIKSGVRKIKLNLNNIFYLKALQNYTVIHTKDSKEYVLEVLGSLLSKNEFADFIRVHRSYAINKQHIEDILSKEISLRNGTKIPIGRSYKSELEAIFKSF